MADKIDAMSDWIETHGCHLAYGLVLTTILALIGLFLFKAYEQNEAEENRVYTMVVDVYYNQTPERHTYVSDGREIVYLSFRGTNSVHGDRLFISTSAPIKVVSYTYKEKN